MLKINHDEMYAILDNFSFHGKIVPSHMREGIVRYFCDGVRPGEFLNAVLINDLRRAKRCADDTNLWLIPIYVTLFENFAPPGSWGSRRKVREFLRGFSGNRNLRAVPKT